jgi:hypothetical protein
MRKNQDDRRLCQAEECPTRSGYGICLTDLYCYEHSKGGIVNYTEISDMEEFKGDKPCGIYKCDNIGEYNFGNCKPLMCKLHSITDSSLYKVNLLRAHKTPRDCTYNECNSTGNDKKATVALKKINPENNQEKENTGIFCKECYNNLNTNNKINSMVNQGVEKIYLNCLEKDCKNRRIYGTTSSGVPTICEDHYLASNRTIVNVANKGKKCTGPNCKTRGVFNYDGLKPAFCRTHKEPGMINTDAKRCASKDCKIQPTFGFKDEVATMCKDHIIEGMVDVKSLLCEIEECNTQAAYGYDKKIRCGKHKTGEMKIICKSQVCDEESCEKFACYGFENENQTKCYTHRLDNMTNVKNQRCGSVRCSILSSYGYEDKRTRERCSKHKLENMVDLTLIMCSECKETNMNPKYKPYCYQCFAKLNPDSERVIEYKTKETAFIEPLKNLYIKAILDKKIEGSNQKFRPDFLLKLETHSVIVEIDERQHVRKNYNEELEKRRLESFKSSLDNKLLIVIRLNPDNYRINNKKDLVYGCFKHNKDTLRLEKKEEEFQIRLNSLLQIIKYCFVYNNVKKIVDSDIGYKELYLFYSQ